VVDPQKKKNNVDHGGVRGRAVAGKRGEKKKGKVSFTKEKKSGFDQKAESHENSGEENYTRSLGGKTRPLGEEQNRGETVRKALRLERQKPCSLRRTGAS